MNKIRLKIEIQLDSRTVFPQNKFRATKRKLVSTYRCERTPSVGFKGTTWWLLAVISSHVFLLKSNEVSGTFSSLAVIGHGMSNNQLYLQMTEIICGFFLSESELCRD